MNTRSLYRLDKNDSEKLSLLLTECFKQDPLYCELIPQKDKRNKLLPEIFSCDLDEMFENCEVYADSEAVNGIIVVSDETEPYNPLRYAVSQCFYAVKTLLYLVKEDWSLQTLSNFIKGREYLNEEWVEDLHQEKRIHIVYFAVRPSMRGRGVASKLMKAVLHYADGHGLMTSLETHNVKNVRMYEHYGFRLFGTMQKHFKLKQFCMVR